jgi:hypothetical protein
VIKTYGIRTAVCTEVRGQRDGTAEAEEHAQSIQGDVNNGDAELLDEGSGQEVEQGEEPPYAEWVPFVARSMLLAMKDVTRMAQMSCVVLDAYSIL